MMWSQRGTEVILAYDRGDELDSSIQLSEPVEGEGEGGAYAAIRIDGNIVRLFAPVTDITSCPHGSKIVIRLSKADADAPFWPSLTSALHADAAPSFIVRVDWSRWVDEED